MANKDKMRLDRIYDYRNKLDAVNYFIETILNKTVTMFRYNNLPDSLPERELELILQINGYGIITEHEDQLVALWGGFAPPYDIYYRPTKVLVNNPWAKINKEYEIDKDCILVRNDPLNRGLMPILNKHGVILAEADITLLLALINFRAIYNITANTDSEAESAKEFLKQIEEGRQGVLLSDDLNNDGIKTQPYSQGSTAYLTQVIEMMQYLKGSFYQEIGLDCNYNMKRERLSESEAGLNADILRPLIDAMLEERQKALDKVNKMFGTDISIEFNSSWSKYNIEPEEEIKEEAADESAESDKDITETEEVEDENIEDNNDNNEKEDDEDENK